MFARSRFVLFICLAVLSAMSDGKPRNSSVQPAKKPKADQSFVVNNNCGLKSGDRAMMKYIKEKVDMIAAQSKGTQIVIESVFACCSINRNYLSQFLEI